MLACYKETYTALFKEYRHNILRALKWCGGFYRCPKDKYGKRLGPLVAYAGKYDSPSGEYHFVGDVYANFAKMEEHAFLFREYALELLSSVSLYYKGIITAFCGAPMGSITLASHMAAATTARLVYPEKEILELRAEGRREKSRLVWGRHKPRKDDTIFLVEDVANNFKTTGEMIALCEQEGATVVGICALFNRSPNGRIGYQTKDGHIIPVISLWMEPFPEYQQDDENVWEDIRDGNVVWKPKDDAEWAKLMQAMEKHGNS